MPIKQDPNGGSICMTGHGDMPEGGISFYTLLHAASAAKMHVESGGRMILTRTATPSNLVNVLNSHYPDRPDGPFKARTMKVLWRQIKSEVQRQKDLALASDPEYQNKVMDRILAEPES